MSAQAPELPRRTPGLAGNEFERLRPLIEGAPACFECEHEAAAFRLAMIQPTFHGGELIVTRNLGARCVGRVAADLPEDVDIVITRIRKDTP